MCTAQKARHEEGGRHQICLVHPLRLQKTGYSPANASITSSQDTSLKFCASGSFAPS